MNGQVVKEFLVSLGLETEGAQEFESQVGKASIIVAGLGTAVFAATGLLFGFTKAIAEYYDNLGDMADRTDIAVDAIEEFGYIATMTGSDVAAANSSLEAFSRTAGDAANGMGKGQKVFEQLGISVKAANGDIKDTTALLGEVGEKIKDMDRGQQIAILGRLGVDKTLIGALTSDVSGLRDEFHSLYSAVGLDSAKAAEKSGAFMDAMDRLGFVLSTVGRALAVNFMDRFTDALDSLRKLIVENLPSIMRAIKPVIALVLALADVFIALTYRAAQGIGVIIGWIGDLVEYTNKWVLAIFAVVAAWKYLNLAFLASPVGIILALVVALGLLIDDFMVWQEGGESLIPWDEWKPQIDLAMAAFEYLKAAVQSWFKVLNEIFSAIGDIFRGDFQSALDHLKAAIGYFAEWLYSLFGPVLDKVRDVFMVVFDYIVGIIDKAIGKIKTAIDFVKGAAGAVSSFWSDDSKQGGQAGGTRLNNSPMAVPPLAPSPVAAGGLNAQSIQQQTSIILQGGPDPQANARAIASEQSQVNGDMARNLKGAAR